MRNKTPNTLLSLLGFLSLGALCGGLALMISPSGELLGIDFSDFKNIPFDSFLVPGIILFIALGLLPLYLTIALIKKPDSTTAEFLNIFKDMHWAWTYSLYSAFIVIGWIQIQLIFLQGAIHWLHVFYTFYAILIIIAALLPQVRYHFRK